MTSTLDQPVKAPTFQAVSLRRKVTNQTATVLVTLSVVIAVVPLIWVLYSVITKGLGIVLDHKNFHRPALQNRNRRRR